VFDCTSLWYGGGSLPEGISPDEKSFKPVARFRALTASAPIAREPPCRSVLRGLASVCARAVTVAASIAKKHIKVEDTVYTQAKRFVGIILQYAACRHELESWLTQRILRLFGLSRAHKLIINRRWQFDEMKVQTSRKSPFFCCANANCECDITNSHVRKQGLHF